MKKRMSASRGPKDTIETKPARSTASHDRANGFERTKERERAKRGERTIEPDRATGRKRTEESDRAMRSERTIDAKRARSGERTSEGERDIRDESTMMNDRPFTSLEPLQRLRRDIKQAGSTLTPREARYLTDLYYQMQDNRIRGAGQIRSMDQAEDTDLTPEPHETIAYFTDQSEALEDQIKAVLGAYAARYELGQWALGIYGIGPVITAGLLSHIDITKCPTAGHVWAFAGLDPTKTWDKKQKRPWNARLKVLCWKAGESFVKFSGRADCYYGQVWADRKRYEWERNLSGGNAATATASLDKKRFGDHTNAKRWMTGTVSVAWAREHVGAGDGFGQTVPKFPDSTDCVPMLPPAQIHARARRYAVKLFLAHFWQRGREIAGLPVPLPYPIAILGHAHLIPPPSSCEAIA